MRLRMSFRCFMKVYLEELAAPCILLGSSRCLGRGCVALLGAFAALGGFLFGLDLGYIGGIESMETFREDVSHGEMTAVQQGPSRSTACFAHP